MTLQNGEAAGCSRIFMAKPLPMNRLLDPRRTRGSWTGLAGRMTKQPGYASKPSPRPGQPPVRKQSPTSARTSAGWDVLNP